MTFCYGGFTQHSGDPRALSGVRQVPLWRPDPRAEAIAQQLRDEQAVAAEKLGEGIQRRRIRDALSWLRSIATQFQNRISRMTKFDAEEPVEEPFVPQPSSNGLESAKAALRNAEAAVRRLNTLIAADSQGDQVDAL